MPTFLLLNSLGNYSSSTCLEKKLNRPTTVLAFLAILIAAASELTCVLMAIFSESENPVPVALYLAVASARG